MRQSLAPLVALCASAHCAGDCHPLAGSSEHDFLPTRVLHQSWADRRLPVKLADLRAGCVRHADEDVKAPTGACGTWEHRLWTDAENRALIAEHYPWFLPSYEAMPLPVMRADAARYAYLHRFG
eukprot:CAMPEP_0117576004 /NCGR_PEP_ID=MMETSP0784-20121206/62545_1 /TAXON_ID=39447 /ORGANISM="" /LENGTH=123 /DNA_ID=CAMNT_0005375185 /DNA_START=37 /DNA_END=405 /DNA_ORIENTATION=+